MKYSYIQQVNNYFFKHQINTKEFIESLQLDDDQFNEESINIQDIWQILKEEQRDENLVFQVLAFILLQTGLLPNCQNSESKDYSKSIDWNKKISTLIQFGNEHKDVLKNGLLRLSITSQGLIKVERIGENETIVGYFNTSSGALGFNSVTDISQNYLVGKLLPEGFIIRVNK